MVNKLHIWDSVSTSQKRNHTTITVYVLGRTGRKWQGGSSQVGSVSDGCDISLQGSNNLIHIYIGMEKVIISVE